MLHIAVIDAGCCRTPGAPGTGEYARFLQAEFDGAVEVALYDVEVGEGPQAVPPELYQGLAAQGADSVPVLAIDGELIAHGQLPGRIDSLELIRQRLETKDQGGSREP